MSAEDDGPTSVDDASIADRVTRLVLQRLEEGVVPWRKPWHTTRQAPRPLGSRRPYRGWNRMVLSWAGFLSPCWVTAERAARRGFGSCGTLVGRRPVYSQCTGTEQRSRIGRYSMLRPKQL